jgi:hypothetical protein
VERSCGPMNKNRIEGGAEQGERATDREALVAKFRWRRSGGRAVKECVLTWGDLALCLKGQRCKSEREVSQGRISWRKSVKGRTRRSDSLEGDVLEMASDVRIGGTVRKGRGEAKSVPGSDEDRRPRPHTRSTG